MASDARDKEISIDDYVRYVDTGTIGKVLDIKTEDEIDWVLLDKTNLWYKSKLVEWNLISLSKYSNSKLLSRNMRYPNAMINITNITQSIIRKIGAGENCWVMLSFLPSSEKPVIIPSST